jgi:chromosome segregation ATPase
VAEASHSSAIASLKKSIEEDHAAEVEKLIAMHNETQEALRLEGATQSQAQLDELRAKHNSLLEELTHQSQSTTEELAKVEAAKSEVDAALNALKAEHVKSQEEVDELSQQLALEKMEKFTAQAELDAAKNAKPDTSELDALKAQLAALAAAHDKEVAELKASHEKALAGAGDATSKTASELSTTREELAMAQKELEAHKLEAEAVMKTSEADYKDMHDSMTQIVEEAQALAAENMRKLATVEQQVGDADKKIAELSAQLKVKDAELAEARVCLPSDSVSRG